MDARLSTFAVAGVLALATLAMHTSPTRKALGDGPVCAVREASAMAPATANVDSLAGIGSF